MAILTKVILLLIGSEQNVYFLIQMRVINKEEEKYGQKFKSESSEKRWKEGPGRIQPPEPRPNCADEYRYAGSYGSAHEKTKTQKQGV